jgi:hypothetical protein
MALEEGWAEWRNGWRKIKETKELHGIEKPVARMIYILKIFTPLQLLLVIFGPRVRSTPGSTDVYVVAVTVVLFLLLWLADYWPSVSFWLASYFLASVIVYLLNVVLLTKVFGPVLSPERSLILLMLNVTQVVLIFAIFYSSLGISNPLSEALLVFGTINFPPKARSLAAFQISIDFLLLAVFLAHFIGGLGRGDKT